MADNPNLNRVDLADTAAPARMAAAVHRQLGSLTGAVPIDEIAYALDITAIRRVELDGCEGVLVTDALRNYGQIAVDTRGGPRRVRFSIAHELGHFLLEHHVLEVAIGFICEAGDMSTWGGRSLHHRQEEEANRFAIELLAPAYLMEPYLAGMPDLGQALEARSRLNVSLEAVARRYIDLHDEPLGAVMSQNGIIRYVVRAGACPWIKLGKGDRLPPATAAHRTVAAHCASLGALVETQTVAWLNNPDVELFEQTRLGENGFAITLLWAPRSDDTDERDESRPPGFRWR